MKKIFFILISLLFLEAAFSQSAEKITEILEAERLPFGKAAYLCETAISEENIDSITETSAFEKLKDSGVIKSGRNEDDEVSAEEFCFIIANTYEVDGSLFLMIFKNPRYVFRQMKADGVVPKNLMPGEKISGQDAMFIISDCIDFYKPRNDFAAYKARGKPLDFEHGGIFYTDTSLRFDGGQNKTAVIDESETLAPYIKTKIFDDVYISSEAIIRHKLFDVFGVDYKALNKIVIDLPLLKAEKRFSFKNDDSLRLAAGRMFMIDATGAILSQTSDGVLAKYTVGTYGNMEAGLYFGYTGFQNIKNTEMLCADGSKYTLENEKSVYDFASPYILGAASFVVPNLFLEQTLSLEAIGVFKSSGPNKLPANDKNRFYFTTMLSGQILPTLFHSVSVTAQTNSFTELALFGKFLLTYYAPFNQTRITFSSVYASGKNGALSPFVCTTRQSSSLSAEEPGYSGIFKAGLDGSIVPFNFVDTLSVSLGANALFDVSGVSEKSGFYGFQLEAGINWDVFSDLNVAIGLNTFIGKDADTARTEITAGVTLGF